MRDVGQSSPLSSALLIIYIYIYIYIYIRLAELAIGWESEPSTSQLITVCNLSLFLFFLISVSYSGVNLVRSMGVVGSGHRNFRHQPIKFPIFRKQISIFQTKKSDDLFSSHQLQKCWFPKM